MITGRNVLRGVQEGKHSNLGGVQRDSEVTDMYVCSYCRVWMKRYSITVDESAKKKCRVRKKGNQP